MLIFDVIDKKRKGLNLTKDEIEFAVNGFVKGDVLPEQMSALLMAIVINGMSDKETYHLTKIMQNSGKTYKFPFEVVDKHSSGGVGDSTTLILLPTLAALGVKVAKMSGKSLGFTGGTIDKVSCFQNFKTDLTQKQFENVITKVGGSVISQSEEIALADKKIYALRDKCACVESIPLIASSIMSKKLACGSNTILLDVKYGSGAFMKTKASAIKLAKTMVKLGKLDGKNVVAMVTNMNTPLSNGIGCGPEVYSVIKALKGEEGSLLSLSKTLSAQLYSMATNIDYAESLRRVEQTLVTGKAEEKLREIVKYQGGSVEVFDAPESLLDAKVKTKINSRISGYVKNIDALTLARVEKYLQQTANEQNKKFCGIMLNVKVGDYVKHGDLLATLYSYEKVNIEVVNMFYSGFEFSNKKVKPVKLVAKIIK